MLKVAVQLPVFNLAYLVEGELSRDSRILELSARQSGFKSRLICDTLRNSIILFF